MSDSHVMVTTQTVEEFEAIEDWKMEHRVFASLDRITTLRQSQPILGRYQFFPEYCIRIQRYEVKKCKFGECTSPNPNIKVDWACVMNDEWMFTIERDAFTLPPLPLRYTRRGTEVDSHANYLSYWLCVTYKNTRHVISTMQECKADCGLDSRRKKLWNWVIGNMLTCFYPNGMLIPIGDIDPEQSMEYTLDSLLPLTIAE